MITAIRVKNFKSLADFKLEALNNFTCIIGLNGSGKSTLLQVFDFMGQLAFGKEPDAGDIVTVGKKSSVSFEADFETPNEPNIKRWRWTGLYNTHSNRFTLETVSQLTDQNNNPVLLFSSTPDEIKIARETDGSGLDTIRNPVSPSGSILASLADSWLGYYSYTRNVLRQIKAEMQSLKTLGVLSPNTLRRGSRAAEELSTEGENLAGYLSRMPPKERDELATKLTAFYGHSTDFKVKPERFGWKNIRFTEDGRIFSAKQTNDGLLRALAILSQRYTKHQVVLFDEIENGFNQELIEKLVNELLHFNGKQVFVTTHSAVIVNYLPDAVARQSVVLLYKDRYGYTQAMRFFEIPDLSKMLEIMGAGQVMSRTNLEELTNKLAGN